MKFYRRIAPIMAMTFDLDDTLYDNYPVIVRMERELLSWLQQAHPAVEHMQKADWLNIKKRVLLQTPELKSDVTLCRLAQLKQGFLDVGYDAKQAQSAAEEGLEVALGWRSQFEVPQLSLDVLTQLGKKLPLLAITNGNGNEFERKYNKCQYN